jgi:hypothetical protein
MSPDDKLPQFESWKEWADTVVVFLREIQPVVLACATLREPKLQDLIRTYTLAAHARAADEPLPAAVARSKAEERAAKELAEAIKAAVAEALASTPVHRIEGLPVEDGAVFALPVRKRRPRAPAHTTGTGIKRPTYPVAADPGEVEEVRTQACTAKRQVYPVSASDREIEDVRAQAETAKLLSTFGLMEK